METIKKQIKNVPELRFPEFSGEWEEKKLGELFSFFATNSFSRDDLNYEIGEVKNIHYGDIHTKFRSLFNITKENVPFINKEILNKKIEINYCKEGDIVIADASEDYEGVGKAIELVELNNEKVVAGLHTLMARPINNMFIIGFIGHMMKSFNIRYQIKMIAQGTKVLSISSKRMKEIILNIPSFLEQQKIAAFLTAVDKKIELTDKKIKHLENYKKGLMQKLLTGKIRFPKFSGEWKLEKFDNIFLKKSYKNYQINKSKYLSNGLYPVIDQGKEKIVGYSNDFDKTINASENNIIVFGDHTREIKFIDFDCIIGADGTQLLRTKGNFDLKFFYYQLLNKKIPNMGYARHFKFLKKINFSYPLLSEQQKIASFLTLIDKKIELFTKKSENLKAYKKGLLQKMFV